MSFSPYFQTLVEGPFRRQETYEVEIPFECDLPLVIQILGLLEDSTSASLRKLRPTDVDLQALEYLQSLDEYVLQYEEKKNHFRVEKDSRLIVREQILQRLDQISLTRLTEMEHRFLFQYGLYDTYLRELLSGPSSRERVTVAIQRRYPLEEYADWADKIDPLLYRQMIPFLPAPMDAIVSLSSDQAQTIRSWLDREIGFQPELLKGLPGEWMIAGSFLTSMLDTTGKIQFGDIDFWISGEHPRPMIDGILQMMGQKPSANYQEFLGEEGDTPRYGNYFLEVKARSGRTIHLSLNPADTFSRADLLRYFDLDPCKFVLDRTGLYGTVRSLQSLKNRVCVLPHYFDFDLSNRGIHQHPQYHEMEVFLNIRSYLLLTNERLPIRIAKYQVKGFTFQEDELFAYYSSVDLLKVWHAYLPDGGWIVNTYLTSNNPRSWDARIPRYSSRLPAPSIREFADGHPHSYEKEANIRQVARIWPNWPHSTESPTPAQLAIFRPPTPEPVAPNPEDPQESQDSEDLEKQ